jgi:hypothetical protein
VTINIRRQLTLFVDPKDAETIEQVRREFNPVQFGLIRSHVTLCREDEIQNLEQVISNLLSLAQEGIVIEFEKPARFDNGKGLFLPATTDNADFQELRRQVLNGLNNNLKKQEPHITLMHPRNSTCTDDIFQRIEKVSLPTKLKFKRISLIEQVNAGQWKILQEFELKGRIFNT